MVYAQIEYQNTGTSISSFDGIHNWHGSIVICFLKIESKEEGENWWYQVDRWSAYFSSSLLTSKTNCTFGYQAC